MSKHTENCIADTRVDERCRYPAIINSLCLKHYHMWREGRLKVPELGKYEEPPTKLKK